MNNDKLTLPLQHYLETSDASKVEVIVELSGTNGGSHSSLNGTKSNQIKFLKESFSKQLHDVERIIKTFGGDVIDSAWINHTLKVQMPRSSLKHLADIQCVELIDLPRKLKSSY